MCFSGDEREGRIDSKNGRIASNMMYVPKDTVKGLVQAACIT